MTDIKKLESILPGVLKPARYTGGEYGEVCKDSTKVKLRYAMCFPDVYEVGMSHMGSAILYDVENSIEDVFAERCFCPWPDMQEAMRNAKMPLFSLETKTPLSEFDMLGFNLSYEMCYTNVLAMLDLASIPFCSKDRADDMPVLIAGGGCTYNPEPMALIFDAFVIGEGEEVLPELFDIKMKCSSKEQFLEAASNVQGVYVPGFYDTEYNEDNTVKCITAKKGAPETVQKRVIKDFETSAFPLNPIVPYLDVVHDRVTLELMRGCSRGCRFCQAGFVYRPVRERSADTLLKQAKTSIQNTGHEEVSLSSLSTGDYSQIAKLVGELSGELTKCGVSLAVPSLRVDSYTGEYSEQLSAVRNASLTFAPEAGTQRLRDIINKNITEEDILGAARSAFEGGTNSVKLYFMIGLPGETDEDVLGIVSMVKRIKQVFFEVPKEKRRGGPKLTVSAACFVPKPHTPFQWAAQDTIEELKRKQMLLRDEFKKMRDVKFNWHDANTSMLEAVFSRGDRRLFEVLKIAYENGCGFDSWKEHFKYYTWQSAFEEAGIDPSFYANRKRDTSETLPWDMISAGLNKEFLIKEYDKAEQQITTPDCRQVCSSCGLKKAGLCI